MIFFWFQSGERRVKHWLMADRKDWWKKWNKSACTLCVTSLKSLGFFFLRRPTTTLVQSRETAVTHCWTSLAVVKTDGETKRKKKQSSTHVVVFLCASTRAIMTAARKDENTHCWPQDKEKPHDKRHTTRKIVWYIIYYMRFVYTHSTYGKYNNRKSTLREYD